MQSPHEVVRRAIEFDHPDRLPVRFDSLGISDVLTVNWRQIGTGDHNFKQTVDALLDGDGAIEVKDENELFQAIKKCLDDPKYAWQIAQNGREVIIKNQGATRKTIEQAIKLLNK